MFKTAEIDRSKSCISPRPGAGGSAQAAIAVTVGFHALAVGLLAAITIQFVPLLRSNDEARPAVKILASDEPIRIPTPIINQIVIGRPPLSAVHRTLQVPTLRYSPPDLTVPEAITTVPTDGEAAEFGAEFLPTEQPREAEKFPQPAANKPPPLRHPRSPAAVMFTQAEVLSTAKPYYPESARRRGHEGTAYVRLTVDAGGEVTAAAISKSSGHPALDASALKAAAKWRFKPAHSGGRTASTQVVVPIRFTLR